MVQEWDKRGRDGGAEEVGGGSCHSDMVAEHGSDPWLQEVAAEEETASDEEAVVEEAAVAEEEADGGRPREACRIGFEMEQQDEKIVEFDYASMGLSGEEALAMGLVSKIQEVETEKKVITLDMVYEKLQGLERMIDEACREKVMARMDKVNAVASKRELKADMHKVDPQKVETAEETADSGRWTGGRIFRWFWDKTFGFARVGADDVFVHTSALEGISDGIAGQRVMMKIIQDKSRSEGAYRDTTAKRSPWES